MSHAYFCDRCGTPYPISNVTTIEAHRVDDNLRTLGSCANRTTHFQLCPKCVLLLDQFLDALRED